MTTKTGEFMTSGRNLMRYSSDDRLSFVLIEVIMGDIQTRLNTQLSIDQQTFREE